MTATATSEVVAAPAPAQDAPTLLEQQASEGQDAAAAAKPADGQTDKTADTGKPAEQKPAGPPEKYEFKAPEGRQFDDKVIGAYSEVARELGLSQEAAQRMLDKVAPVMQTRLEEQVQSARATLFAKWAEETKADKEIGGDKLKPTLALAAKAIDRFGGKELRTLLVDSGYGNHKALIAAFAKVGKAISEDAFVTGDRGPSREPQSLREALYGSKQ